MSIFYEVIKNNIDGYADGNQWNYFELVQNEYFPTQLLDDYPDDEENKMFLRMAMMYMSKNKAITPEYIELNIDGIKGEQWDVYALSKNKSLTIEFIEKYIHWDWYMAPLSKNPCITWNFIKKHIKGINGKPWYIANLVFNINISLDNYLEILETKEYEHYQNQAPYYLSNSPLLTLDYVEKMVNENPNCEFDKYGLSANPIITEEFVMRNPKGVGNNKWSIEGLCVNPSISTQFACKKIFEKGENFYFHFPSLFENPNVDYEFLFKYNSENKLRNYFATFSDIPKTIKLRFKYRFYTLTFDIFNNGITSGAWKRSNLKMKIPNELFFRGPTHFVEKNCEKLYKNLTSNEIMYAPWMTLDFINQHPQGINGFAWSNDIFSNLCSCLYIYEHPEGYLFGDKLISWNADVLSSRSWKIHTLKSAKNI